MKVIKLKFKRNIYTNMEKKYLDFINSMIDTFNNEFSKTSLLTTDEEIGAAAVGVTISLEALQLVLLKKIKENNPKVIPK